MCIGIYARIKGKLYSKFSFGEVYRGINIWKFSFTATCEWPYIRRYTSTNEVLNMVIPILMHFCSLDSNKSFARRVKQLVFQRNVTSLMTSDCIWQYIAGYTIAIFWRYPIRRHITKSSALDKVCDWFFSDGSNPPKPCGQGYYCPLMSSSPDQYPCPPGTFSSSSSLSDASQCTNCTAGYYCKGKLYFIMIHPQV